MLTANQLASLIKQNESQIFSNLSEESIAVYEFIRWEFEKSEETRSDIFQFVYSRFYGMTPPRATPEFVDNYFNILKKSNRHSKLEEIANQLAVEDSNGNKKLYFSFATKLLHTIDNEKPIYDNRVAEVFNMTPRSDIKDFKKKLALYCKRIDEIRNVYKEIFRRKLIKDVLKKFDSKYKHQKMSNMKKLDFLVWTLGKLQSKKKKSQKP